MNVVFCQKNNSRLRWSIRKQYCGTKSALIFLTTHKHEKEIQKWALMPGSFNTTVADWRNCVKNEWQEHKQSVICNIYRIKRKNKSISEASRECSLEHSSNTGNSRDKKVNRSKIPLSFKFYRLLAVIQNKTLQKGNQISRIGNMQWVEWDTHEGWGTVGFERLK